MLLLEDLPLPLYLLDLLLEQSPLLPHLLLPLLRLTAPLPLPLLVSLLLLHSLKLLSKTSLFSLFCVAHGFTLAFELKLTELAEVLDFLTLREVLLIFLLFGLLFSL